MLKVAAPKFSLEPETDSLLSRLSSFLAERDIKAYLVGGFVRDLLLGRATADIDIALDADALEVCERIAVAIGGKPVPLDDVHRICRFVILEDGSRRELDFSTITGSIEEDLANRDFTINAIAIALDRLVAGDPRVIDPFDGCGDLDRKLVRATSEECFRADPVRLLRGIRLASELGFAIEPATDAMIWQNSRLVAAVPGERVREELLRLLAVPGEFVIPELDRLGLLTAIMPELEESRGAVQPKEHFWDVLNHSIRVPAAADFLLRQGDWLVLRGRAREALAAVPWSEELENYFKQGVSHGSTRRTMLKLAALLHDVAKPRTKTVEPDGRVRFFEHAAQGALISGEMLRRLRFAGKEIRLVEMMVRNHMRPTQLSRTGLPTRHAIYRYLRDTGDAAVDTLFLSLADHLATRGPRLSLPNWREHARIVEHVIAQYFEPQGAAAPPPRLITGHDIIVVFGLAPGKRIGELLEAVREAQAAGELTTREEALDFVRNQLQTKQENET